MLGRSWASDDITGFFYGSLSILIIPIVLKTGDLSPDPKQHPNAK
ncbi:hypothetical protein SPWS13_4485 [Shewanella putrefaciens]|nr:hypothetical protein SPWS13_4485 [Shewanella putrefaciens]